MTEAVQPDDNPEPEIERRVVPTVGMDVSINLTVTDSTSTTTVETA